MDLAVFPDEEEEDEAGLDLLPVVGRVRLLLPRVFLCPFYGVACFLFSAALSSLASSPPSLHASFSFSAWETSLLPSVITQYTLTDGTPLEQV